MIPIKDNYSFLLSFEIKTLYDYFCPVKKKLRLSFKASVFQIGRVSEDYKQHPKSWHLNRFPECCGEIWRRQEDKIEFGLFISGNEKLDTWSEKNPTHFIANVMQHLSHLVSKTRRRQLVFSSWSSKNLFIHKGMSFGWLVGFNVISTFLGYLTPNIVLFQKIS